MTGRKRHLLVDTLGLIWGLVVHSAKRVGVPRKPWFGVRAEIIAHGVQIAEADRIVAWPSVSRQTSRGGIRHDQLLVR